MCVGRASSALIMPATTCGRNGSSPPARQLQQLAHVLWGQRLGDVFERDRVLHHVVKGFDLVELQHRLGKRLQTSRHSLEIDWILV